MRSPASRSLMPVWCHVHTCGRHIYRINCGFSGVSVQQCQTVSACPFYPLFVPLPSAPHRAPRASDSIVARFIDARPPPLPPSPARPPSLLRGGRWHVNVPVSFTHSTFGIPPSCLSSLEPLPLFFLSIFFFSSSRVFSLTLCESLLISPLLPLCSSLRCGVTHVTPRASLCALFLSMFLSLSICLCSPPHPPPRSLSMKGEPPRGCYTKGLLWLATTGLFFPTHTPRGV